MEGPDATWHRVFFLLLIKQLLYLFQGLTMQTVEPSNIIVHGRSNLFPRQEAQIVLFQNSLILAAGH